MEMLLTRTRGNQTAAMTLTASGDLDLAMVLRINGVITDDDLTTYDTVADRDAALECVVDDMVSAGYTCLRVED